MQTAPAKPEAAPVSTAIGPRNTFRSLRYHNYRSIWFGIVFGSLGQWMEQVALGWLVYELTESPFLLSVVVGARSVPLLLFGPFGGVAADRFDRRRMLLISQAIVMVLAFIIALLTITGRVQVWHLALISFLGGCAWSFNIPARQSLVPNVVPRGEVMNAVALQSSGFQMTAIIGPTVAGLLIAIIGAGGVFLVNSALFVFVLFATWQLRLSAKEVDGEVLSVGRSLLEGLKFVRSDRIIFTALLLALFPTVFGLPVVAMMPVFARDVLRIGAQGLGYLNSALGVGAIVATLSIASIANVSRKGRVLIVACTTLGCFLMLFSQSRWVPLSLVALLFVGASRMGFMALINTAIQLTVPDQYRGRVMSLLALDFGLTPLGTLLAGTIATYWGVQVAITLFGLICATAGVVAWLRLRYFREAIS